MEGSSLEEKLEKVASCLVRLSEIVSELAASVRQCPTQEMVDEVERKHEEQAGWRSEVLDEKCPRCGSPRIRKVDPRTGEEFIGCSSYPACRWRQRRQSPLKRKVAAVVEASRTPPPDLSKLPF